MLIYQWWVIFNSSLFTYVLIIDNVTGNVLYEWKIYLSFISTPFTSAIFPCHLRSIVVPIRQKLPKTGHCWTLNLGHLYFVRLHRAVVSMPSLLDPVSNWMIIPTSTIRKLQLTKINTYRDTECLYNNLHGRRTNLSRQHISNLHILYITSTQL